MKFSMCALALSIVLSACGGDDDSKNSDNCQGHQVDTSKVCDLQCNVSTMDQTKQLLGQPDASTSGLLEYNYTCVEGSTGSAQSWDFYFNDTGALTSVTLTGVGSFAGETVPDCLASCHL